MKTTKLESCSLTTLSLILATLVAAPPSNSQPITPTNDGTNTTVTPEGNQFNIEGGTRNGANLFHSFEQFNVNSGQTANFLTTPDIRNILGRVTGGNASYINGLIQVIGGNSNLFLMNPAGIMFGPNATLNIPASFSVTTATGIGFDNNNFWFKAIGTNDYSNLVGNPSGYRFNPSTPGAIVNEGNLTLDPGENLTLLGGTVINTGELSTAGGNITIAAVEGGSVLRISQPEHLLSLEVETFQGTSLENGENTNITPLSLPQLLTGGEETHASSVIVNANGDVVLTDSNTLVADTPGTAITSGNIDVSTTFLSQQQGVFNPGGQVNVLGSRVGLIDTNINANGTNGGGTVLIGGDFQGNGIVPNSQQTFVNNNSFISADAINNGDGGRVIVWSDGITNFAGNISAKGGDFSGDGGFVEVSGKQELIFDGSVDVSAVFGNPGTILLDPENITVGEENSETETETEGDNSEVSATENLENSETETEGDNSEVSATENSENLETTENTNNSEVLSPENTDSQTTEIAENSETETVENNSEVSSPENTDSQTTEIAENSETLIDPFAQDENADVTISAENLGELSGDVILLADNDITINEKIETDSSVEIKAGRSININADIDTSVGNGNIDLLGNNDEMNLANRSEGAASINQLDGTTLKAGSGTINIELGNLGEVGDINLGSLTTTGEVFVNANGGNIARVSDSSIINAGSVLFQTSGNGGIGLTNAPLRLNVDSLEAVSGSGGVFFDVGNVNIGGVSEDVNGIATAGGDIDIKSDGNVTLTEAISTVETVENNSEVEATENTEITNTNGSINIEATGDIVATGSGIKGGGESVSLSATNIRINDEFDETSGDADVKLEATNDITVEDIEDDALEFLPGSGEIEFRADVDGDGVGIVEMLDNEADVGSNPGTFENGADTIKTNGRSLTIAGAGIVLGNIDTSWLPVFSGGELLAAIDVDEGGAIPPEDGGDTAIFTFTVDGDLGTVENLDVRFSAAHTFNSDLEVYLQSPQGNEVTLFARVGGWGDNFQDTVLDDDASRSISSGLAPFDGTYRPQGNLAEFNGENPNGTWTLRVTDTYPSADDGTLYRAGDTTAPWGTATGTQLLLRNSLVQSGGRNGGAINIEATHGDINVGNIRSLSETGNGGRIDLKANNNIMTGLINSSAVEGIGGDVNLYAISGKIETFSLDTSSLDGDGGNIEMKAAGDIITEEVTTDSGEFLDFRGVAGSGNAGNISIESTEGSINTTGSIFARSVSQDGGEITISTQTDDITTGTLYSRSSGGNGGEITISTQTGNVTTGRLDSRSSGGNGGEITISTQTGDITTEWLYSRASGGNGGDITISTQTGDITTEVLISDSLSGNGGKITISTQTGDITTEWLDSYSLSSGNGGKITISTHTGDITTGSLDSLSDEGNGGDITISTQTGDITTGSLNSSSPGDGGEITISTQTGDINTQRILSSSPEDGGEITISTQAGDITTGSLDSFSNSRTGNSGNGGTISLTAETIKFNPPEFGDAEQLAIRTFSVGSNGSGKGGDVNITTNNLTNAEILTLSSHENSGEVTIESKSQGNLELNDLSIITSKQVTVEILGRPIQIDVGATQGQSGDVSIISNGNLNLNNVNIESDTKSNRPAGNVNINSLGNITLDNTEILSITSAEGNAGNITLEADQNILLTNNSRLQASTEATGNAGNINIRANNLNLEQSTSLITETLSAGNPGDITINAPTIDIGEDAQISATVIIGSTSTGDGSNITINTNELNITGELGIFAETEASANAGTLTISPYKDNPNLDINFTNDGFISASTSSTGNGGNIFIKAPENIDISGQGFIAVETSGTGDAGTIDIQTDNLTISDGVSINASTIGAGNAGQININTTDFTLETGTSLTTETNSAGKAGDITINSPTVTIGENASISATALEGATNTETGGNISIFSNTLNISGELGIFAQTEGESPAGTLTLKPYSDNPDLDINFTNKGFISASTSSTGNGGNINIFAPETIDISGDGKITVETTGSGSAGDIEINTGSLTVSNGAEISANTGSNSIDASSNGNGSGGNIRIEATEIVNLDNDSRLSVESRGAGKAGNIEIYSPEVNVTTNSLISADVREGATNREEGGNITIDTNTLNISSSEIFAQTQGETPAGTITLKPYNNNSGLNINLSNEGTISASTQSTGGGGNISIAAPETIDIIGDGQIVAGSNGAGKAGNIEINSQQLTIAENARIRVATIENSTNTEGGTISIYANIINLFSSESSESQSEISAETESETSGGTITLKPYEDNSDIEINFSNESTISARTLSTATGNAGDINISAPENIKISGDGSISAENSGAGRGGNITIEATESIDLRNLEISAESTSTSTGNAGEIRIESKELTIAEGTTINASTEGRGNAGAIDIDTQTFTLETGTSLTTETESAGQAGNITINSERLTMGEGTVISATAKAGSTSTEDGGNITINTNDLEISGELGIFAETEGNANAGILTINPYRAAGEQGSRTVGRLHATSLREFDPNLNITFTENGFISARTFSTGNGGDINIFAPENINISGAGRITVETKGAGNAGIININTENLTIAENTTISAATSDTGDGGSININPNQTFQLEGQIITETTGTGNGGTITINTGEMNAPNSIISAKSTSAGNAGEINILAENNITTGIITSEANNTTETADGGNISIASEQGEINATQPIQSFSERGNAGDVTLTAQNDITTNIISSHGQQQGGQITITSETGNIETSNGFLANYSGGGDAGNVTIEAPQGNITTNNIYSFADGDGGQISIKAGGDINLVEDSKIISASEPPSNSSSDIQGKGGDIILEAGNNINTTTAQIYSGANIGDTGKIDIIADGAIETGKIDLASGFVRDRVTVNENFTLIPIREGEATQGVAGDITLRSNNNTIDTTAGTINSRSPDGTGNIIFNARDNITTGRLEASALNQNQPTTGGDVDITSQQGEVNATQEIETFSERGTAGNVNIIAEGSVNIENIISQGRERGGNITIDSRSQNSINAQGTLNTFSDAGTAGNVTLTSPGSITLSGIRSQGLEQGGTITVESEIGEINSTGNIDSFSEQGIGGDVRLNATQSVNLENVSSFGATESGNLIIESRTATVNTGNVTTQAPAGSSGNIEINGQTVSTGNLSSIGTTSAGILQLEANGSITTFDLNSIASEGEAGGIEIDAAGDVTTEDQTVISGDGDAQIDIDTEGSLNADTQTVEATNGNAEIDNEADGNINIDSQTAVSNGGDATINNTAEQINIDSQTAVSNGGDATINNTADQINIDSQTAVSNGGDATINNTAEQINVDSQTAISNGGDATINNTAEQINIDSQTAISNGGDATINNTAEQINIDSQTAISNGGDATINNTAEVINIPEQRAIAPDGTETITNTESNDTTTPIIPTNNPIFTVETNPSTTVDITTTSFLDTTQTNTNTNSNQFPTTPINNNIISTITPSNNNQTINTATAQEQTDSSINNTTNTQEILNRINTVNTNPLTVATGSNQIVTMLEENRIKEYSDYFGEDFNKKLVNTQNVRDILTNMAAQTGKESAVVYINAYADQIQIILFTKDGQPILKTIPTVNRQKLWKNVFMFSAEIIDLENRNTTSYLPLAQKLYQWLIAPISDELEAANIDTILFSMDSGFRLLPLAALHDGEQFLIEKYSISLIPSVSLIDSRYNSVKNTKLLGMGASQFTDKPPLPAVPIELQTISEKLWQASTFLNEEFTKNNLINELENRLYPIVHLATHAEFRAGNANDSYVQLWDDKLGLDEVRKLRWNSEKAELLVLSACRTAVGDTNAELGFAGLAIAAGVKSALGSFWLVSDEGTLGLMTEFYAHLSNVKIKAEALREAQLAMLRGKVVIADGTLRGSGSRGEVSLPSELASIQNKNFTHPYYWAGFTMVGSPW